MKILIAGLGSIGQRHARVMIDHLSDPVQLIAYRTELGQETLPERFQSEIEFFDSMEQALDESPEVAFVTNPTHLHVPTAIRCGEAGCDLFIEKPLSHSTEGIEELSSLVESGKLVTMVGCQLRFHPVLQQIRTILKREQLGKPYHFDVRSGSYLPDWRPNQDYRQSYSARPEQGGGVTLDLIHELDYCSWMLGEPDKVTGFTDQVSELEIESEDIAEVLFQYSTGPLGRIHLNYFQKDPVRKISIRGSKGKLQGDLIEGELWIRSEELTESWEWEVKRDRLFVEQAEHFFDAVRGQGSTFNSIKDYRSILEIALKVRENQVD